MKKTAIMGKIKAQTPSLRSFMSSAGAFLSGSIITVRSYGAVVQSYGSPVFSARELYLRSLFCLPSG